MELYDILTRSYDVRLTHVRRWMVVNEGTQKYDVYEQKYAERVKLIGSFSVINAEPALNLLFEEEE